jgi:hypothetical protein
MGKCVHAIPGRARFHVAAIRDSQTVARVVERRLMALDGVTGVDIRRRSASVVVHYDSRRLALGDLGAALTGDVDHFHSRAPVLPATPMARRETARPLLVGAARHLSLVAGQAAFKVMLERAVSSGVSSLLRSASIRL